MCLHLMFSTTNVSEKWNMHGIKKGETITWPGTNSSKETFEEHLLKFKQRLKARGYPENIIEWSLSGVSFASRQSFLAHTQKLNKKSRQYWYNSDSSHFFWAYCFPCKSFTPMSSWLIWRTGVVFRVFHSGGQRHKESAKGQSLAQKKKIKFKKVTIVRRVRPSVRNEIMTSFHEQFATSAHYKNRICLPISTSLANLELVSHNWTP